LKKTIIKAILVSLVLLNVLVATSVIAHHGNEQAISKQITETLIQRTAWDKIVPISQAGTEYIEISSSDIVQKSVYKTTVYPFFSLFIIIYLITSSLIWLILYNNKPFYYFAISPFMSLKTKKAQMEIMGIAIVIVLMMLGMLFVFQFFILKPPEDIRKGQRKEQLATNMLNAILELTSANCSKHQIRTLIQDCASFYDQDGSIRCENLQTKSCIYVNNTIQQILTNTLDKWNEQYQFMILIDDEEKDIQFGKKCTMNRRRRESPIQARGKTVTLRLDICDV